jgi:hypothetical protein
MRRSISADAGKLSTFQGVYRSGTTISGIRTPRVAPAGFRRDNCDLGKTDRIF